MNARDVYAETVAGAVLAGACLTGHDWDGATYETMECAIDLEFGVAVGGPGQFVQHRRCRRCASRLTVVRPFEPDERFDVVRAAMTLLADARGRCGRRTR
jgi:hypothetical protein